MLAERSQHLGHAAEILRELIDGAAGQRLCDPNLTPRSTEEWAAHRASIEGAARVASNTARGDAARNGSS